LIAGVHHRSAAWPGLAAALLFAASVALRWPGVAMYDSVAQYRQALEHSYSDWHPPIMAETWALLNRIHGGTAPFFLIQMLAWWGGLGLVAAALVRRGRHVAAGCVLAIGASPLMLGWATVVLKDAQMAGCLVAATGIAAHYRLADRRLPWPAGAAILALIGYAALVRGNAAFACAPLALALFDWPGVKGRVARATIGLCATAAILLVSPLVNQRLLGAEASHAERVLPIYDLAGIAHFSRLASVPGLTPEQWRRTEEQGCYAPYFWNPYGEPDQCGFVGETLGFDAHAGKGLMRDWVLAAARHPIGYAEHRLVHLNSNLRLWTDLSERDAVPPANSEPNAYGIGGHAHAATRLMIAAAWWQADSPIGWPVMWLVASLALLWASRPGGDGQQRLGWALALSAACMAASYAVVSIASDLRYHFWSMIAGALAAVLLIDAGALDARRARIGGAALLVVALIGTAARLGLAAPVYAPQPGHVPPPPGARA